MIIKSFQNMKQKNNTLDYGQYVYKKLFFIDIYTYNADYF